jgi:aryl-alcohol dehydrogenase-like predicted oxidoreductase
VEYRELGSTGVFVSRLCLGAMTFGGEPGSLIGGLTQQETDDLVDRALAAGVNFIDTANVYSYGEFEELRGRALGARRQDVVLATKVYGRMGPGPNDAGLTRRNIVRQVEDSLRRLRTDYIDLYQSHAFDLSTPVEETLRAFDDLVRQGKVRYIGCSNHQCLAGDEGLGGFAGAGS